MTRKAIAFLVFVVVLVVAVVDLKVNGFDALVNFFTLTEPKYKISDRKITPTTPKTTVVEEEELDAQGMNQLTLLNPNGSIWITGQEYEKVTVRATYTVYGKTKEAAEEFARSLRTKGNRTGNKLQLELQRPGKLPEEIYALKADYVITAPSSLSLNLEGQGVVQVDNFLGVLEVKNFFGEVEISRIGADVKVRQNSGSVRIKEVKGNLDLHTSFGDVVVKLVGGNLNFIAQANQVYFEEIGGFVKGENSFGKMEGHQIGGKVTLDARMGAVELFDVSDSINIENQFGDVVVHGYQKNVDVKVKQGQVHLLSGTMNHRILAETKYGNLQIPDWSGVQVKKDSNQQRLEATVGVGDYTMDLQASFGSIFIVE